MSKPKATYYAFAHNDQGAVIDVVGRTYSLRGIQDLAREQLGAGWQVKVMAVRCDGDNGWFPPEEVKTFCIRG